MALKRRDFLRLLFDRMIVIHIDLGYPSRGLADGVLVQFRYRVLY